ncbi:MAG TPA: TraR/DksA C4-type zinc finger protein [Candidatus Paceibacterota bacterium]|nr:TraR/DksA C4-type zinc finger protein [Candidatus Paceibacterota bacterium]HRZ34249.1 TraR/DksA C4-type zinc finger protein [Candidatus Paceibacterota bacterium]
MEKEKIDLKYFKDKLLKEEARIVAELKSVGRVNPDNPNDWEPVPGELESNVSDPNDFADEIEQFEQNSAILKELETELVEIKAALKRIDDGTYGICEKTGKQIPLKRLEAYPAARSCAKICE